MLILLSPEYALLTELLFQDIRKNMFGRLSQDQLINQVLQEKQPQNQTFFPADLCSLLHRESQSILTPWVADNAMRTFVEYVTNKGVFHRKPKPTLVQSLPIPLSYWIPEMLWGRGQGSAGPTPQLHPQLHLQVCWLSRMSQVGRWLKGPAGSVVLSLSLVSVSLVLYSLQQALVYSI